MDIVDYIYDECHRQHVTNYGDFAKAWENATNRSSVDSELQFRAFVLMLAMYVEPDQNAFRNYGDPFNDNLRTSHVGFKHGGSAAPAGEVRNHFARWCNNLIFEMNDFQCETITDYIDQDEQLVDMWIKTLLDIHPWADGNGRTASILRNWMLGTLDDPSPLPYYYGQS